LIVVDVVHLESAAIAVAPDHVGLAETAEIAGARELPVQSDRAQRGRTCEIVAVGGNVIDLECAAGGVPQQHVGGVAVEKAAERDKSPIASNFAQLVRRQERVASDTVDSIEALVEAWVEAGRIKSGRAQDQVRGGGECCRLHRELYGGRGVDQARAGDVLIAEGRRRLLQDLLYPLDPHLRSRL